MGRTNIVLNDTLIRQARKLTRLKTKREIVDRALEVLVRSETQKEILRFQGSGILERRAQGNEEKSRLILVDSSVWIEFFSSRSGAGSKELHRIIAEFVPFALTGIIVAEILQGLTREVNEIEKFLSGCERLEPRGLSTFQEAARIFRDGRIQGNQPHNC